MTIATLIVIILVIAVAIFLVATAVGEERTNVWVQILQASATTGAIMLAGYWYFVERRGEPHADVSQTAEVIPLGDGRIAVEVHVQVKNLGRQLLRIDRFVSRMQLADVDQLGMSELIGKSGADYWKSATDVEGTERAHFTQAELRWPQLNYYADRVEHEIEPGESDLLVATFLMDCPPQDYVRIASDVAKPAKEHSDSTIQKSASSSESPLRNAASLNSGADKRRLMWKARSFVDVGKVCGEEKGP